MESQITFEGKILTQISYEQTKEKNLKLVGSCFALNLGHALYLMSQYCKEKELVRYYLIELKIDSKNKKVWLPTNQNTMLIIKFYKE